MINDNNPIIPSVSSTLGELSSKLQNFGGVVILTCGTFDLLHIGHINLLSRARGLGDKLIVGISDDYLNYYKKGKFPIYSLKERMRIISELKSVDHVFIEDNITIETKCEYMHMYGANIFVIGDDWIGKFDSLPNIYSKLYPLDPPVQIIYLKRTSDISTTEIIDNIQNELKICNNIERTLFPSPNEELFQTPKLPQKCLLICRETSYQAPHLLPYLHLFEKKNVYWLIDVENISEGGHCIKNKITQIENFIGCKMDQIIYSIKECEVIKPDICFITESWAPYMTYLKGIGCKVVFIDHGICVGTRPSKWFAMEWNGIADKIFVAGNLQYQHHLKCAGSDKCHNCTSDQIIQVGHPRYSLFTRCETLWPKSIISNTSLKKILFVASSDDAELISFSKIIPSLCANNYAVMIRPHPMLKYTKYRDNILHDLVTKSMFGEYIDKVIVIPPHMPVFTPNLFYDIDLLISDKTSLGYEYLLFDKPAILLRSNSFITDHDPELYLKDAFVSVIDIHDLDINLIQRVISDPPELKSIRKKVKENVFIVDDHKWITLVKNEIKNIMI